jgi:hypothetical protein
MADLGLSGSLSFSVKNRIVLGWHTFWSPGASAEKQASKVAGVEWWGTGSPSCRNTMLPLGARRAERLGFNPSMPLPILARTNRP